MQVHPINRQTSRLINCLKGTQLHCCFANHYKELLNVLLCPTHCVTCWIAWFWLYAFLVWPCLISNVCWMTDPDIWPCDFVPLLVLNKDCILQMHPVSPSLQVLCQTMDAAYALHFHDSFTAQGCYFGEPGEASLGDSRNSFPLASPSLLHSFLFLALLKSWWTHYDQTQQINRRPSSVLRFLAAITVLLCCSRLCYFWVSSLVMLLSGPQLFGRKVVSPFQPMNILSCCFARCLTTHQRVGGK